MATGVGIAIGVAGLAMSGYQIYQSKEAADEAKEISDRNQKAIEAEAAEQERRERFNLGREQSLIRARIAASGIRGKTPEAYYLDYTKRRESEIKWMRSSAEMRSDIAGREGSRAQRIGYAQTAGITAQTAYKSYDWFSTYA